MAMTRVKDFAEELLIEIDVYEKEVIARVMSEMQEAPAIAETPSGSGMTALKRDPHVMVRYESDAAMCVLRDKLERCKQDESEVSEESLGDLISWLLARHSIIEHTNCLYNYSPNSLASLAHIALAKHLFKTLDPIARASGREIKYLHYYDFLFPGLPCSKYKSTTGHVGELQLTEFFWGDDVVKDGVLKEKGRPIPVLASLEAFRHERAMRPPHIYLTQDEIIAKNKARSGGKTIHYVISRTDNERLKSHSKCASDYFMAINDKKMPEDQKDKHRSDLMELVVDRRFVPGYLYETTISNATLVKNGFLKNLDVTSFFELAAYISESVAPDDWKAFLEALPEDALFKLTLPRLPNGTHDLSVLSMEKFEDFVNTDAWYVSGESSHNNAVLIILAELYRRKRNNYEGVFTGAISNMTAGMIGGYPRNVKNDAVDVLMDFFVACINRVNSQYSMNNLDGYLERTHKMQAHGAAIKSDRLLILGSKAKSLWNNVIATSKLPNESSVVQDDQCEEAPQPLTLVYTSEMLRRDALRLSSPGAGAWSEEVKSINKAAFKGFILSCGGVDYGLYNCITNFKHYTPGNDRYNRAVLYILTKYYVGKRGGGSEHNTGYGKYLGAPGKQQKVEAGMLLLQFFESDMPLNHLHEFLVKNGKLAFENIIIDYAPYSETKALAKTAEASLTHEFYNPPKDESLLSRIWGK